MSKLSLEPGALLAGRYRLDSVLGGGGYGVVFEAWDNDVGRRVAVKIPRTKHAAASSAELMERFRREAAAVARLQDPHTVTLFDYGEADGYLYMVFEYVAGNGLGTTIRNHGPLSPAVTAKIALQVLSSLREAHANGLLHRDIKPENIIVYEYMGEAFRAKLVDFGLAKRTEGGEEKLTQEGVVMGTAHYVSPEAYMLRPLGSSSDLFSLGLVMYEMLLGNPVNDAESAVDIAQITCSPEEFVIPAAIPDGLRQVVTKLLRKQPADRYQSAAEVMADLQPLVGMLSDSPISATSRVQEPSKDHTAEAYAPTIGPGSITADDVANYSGSERHSVTASSSSQGVGTLPGRPGQTGGSSHSVQRELTAQDFQSADTGPESPVLDESALAERRVRSARSEMRKQESEKTKNKPRAGKSGGVLGFIAFVLGLLVVLGAAFAGVVWYLELEMPWNKKPPVDPATLPARSFDVTSADTTFRWVDWDRGVAIARTPNDIPAVGRCAMLLESASRPSEPNVYYVVEAVDSLEQVVEVKPIGKEELVVRAEQCDMARAAADSVQLSAEILAAESKLANVERREELARQRRRAARKAAEDATQKRGKVLKLLKTAKTARDVINVF